MIYIINLFSNIKSFFSKTKIKKTKCNYKNILNIQKDLSEKSSDYNSMANSNIQQIFKVIKSKSVRNTEYKEEYFFDFLLYKVLNLKYIPNLWDWKNSFSFLWDLLKFEKIKKKYVWTLYISIGVLLFALFAFLFWNIYIAFANYSHKMVYKIQQKYSNPFTLRFEIQWLATTYKKPRIDKQTIYLIYYIILVIMLFRLISELSNKNKILWNKSYQNFIIPFVIFLELLNKTENYWNILDIPYFNTKEIVYNTIEKLKNDNLINLTTYNQLVSLLTNDFKIKPNWIDPWIYTFLKSLSSLQREWEKNWFRWSLNKIINYYEILKAEQLEKWWKYDWTYQTFLFGSVFTIEFLIYIMWWLYFFSPAWKMM